ncbi:MAG TPA: ABC transporter family substrate-binding protein [Candidatus Corynebacterium avicola]|uniref:ABC transporter family substrate-binding protein n=1 Tax=Candidatus Corynebacterium avicola TaxID=2838527 RepID=A0A9D1RMA3_9CORY|nr:ABC transporter family substrate-binding protein [Candidatus Corynebacterium avicola]
MRRPSTALRYRGPVAVLAALGLVLTGCQANPGDAPTVEDQTPAADDDADTEDTDDDEEDGTSSVPAELRSIQIGVDSVPADLNPHLVSSQSMLTSTVGELTLPSAFLRGDDGVRRTINSDLLASAEVVEGDQEAPEKVVYTINSRAQWSDGTPIVGSDFEYLHEQITTQPGVTETDLYASVEDVTTSAGGRQVTVTFDNPTSQWRELFANLLPSHIYRGENRPFATMMSDVPAASGGLYTVRQFDSGRGTLVLERNTRFWGETPPRSDKLEFSVVNDTDTAAQMLRTGQIQAVASRNSGVALESLRTLPDVQARAATLGRQLTLQLNTTSDHLDSPDARAEILGAVDADRVARLVTGHPRATAPQDDLVADTAGSATGEPGAGLAGVDKENPVRIGADTLDDEAVEAARRVVDNLVAEGIPATVVTPSATEIFSDLLPRGEVDAVVTWQDDVRGWSDLRSRYLCDETDRPLSGSSGSASGDTDESESSASTASSESSVDGSATETSGTSAAARDGVASSEADEAGESSEAQSVPEERGRAANVTGICDDTVDSLLSDEPAGGGLEAVPEELGVRLGELHLSKPLVSDRVLVGTGSGLVGPEEDLSEWPIGPRSGPFYTADRWTRTSTDTDSDSDTGDEDSSGTDTSTDPATGGTENTASTENTEETEDE